MDKEIKNNIVQLKLAVSNLEDQANRQKRNMTPTEENLRNEILQQIQELEMSLPQKALTQPGPINSGSLRGGGHVSAAPSNGKDYRSMFNLSRGSLDTGGFKDCLEFLHVMDSGRYDPRLRIQASMVEGTPASGGFAVPTQFASEWLDASLPNEIVRNLCKVYPMESSEKEIPGWDGANMSSGQTHGGFTMQFLAESGTATPQTAKVRQITLNAKMAGIYVDASIELIQDGRDFATNLEKALKQSIGYGLDRYCISGSGAGCPQGVLNAACKIQISKESGQAADTVQYGNLKKMFARQLNPQSAVWIFNPSTIPELLEQSVAVGTGGSFVPLLNEKDGKFTIFGRPTHFHPSMPTLGDEGDSAFVDFNFYGLGLRKEVWIDQTDAVKWLQRERSFRILMRFDGQCTLDKAITPEHGDTLSPIVTLAERA